MQPVVIGVSGGSGSGKTTIANRILEKVDEHQISYVVHDAYYRDRSHLPPEERQTINFDHPSALETELLVEHLRALKAGRSVQMPQYDFKTHTRRSETTRVEPTSIIVVDGILILEDTALRACMDVKLFVETGADLRFIRRLRRDLRERGRDAASVIEQYLATVRPMHDEFVEPSKRYADVVIPSEKDNSVAVEMIASRINWLLQERSRR